MNCSGWAPPRVLGDFYRRDILYGNAGPTGINRRTETRASEEEREKEGQRERETVLLLLSLPPLSGVWVLESTYLPVGLLLNPRSRLMDSSSPAPMHAYVP